MNSGDFLLIDIWAKKRVAHSVYDDIAWTGFIGSSVPDSHEAIFQVVKNGRDAARHSITHAGFGEWFLHRTGHSIHEEDHGNGANIENLETQDNRRLMRGTCFSIEPGVSLKGQFGVRSEVNVYLAESEAVVTGQPIQTHSTPILSF